MGINRILVKRVFSKSRSIDTHESIMRSNAAERRRWSSVRSYLCGDEFNSVAAEEDSASVRSSKATELTRVEFNSVFAEEDSGSARSSEATVTQPILREGVIEKEKNQEEKQNSTSKLFRRDDAAIVIQTAFRSFLARRQNQLNMMEESKREAPVVTGSPSRDSVSTSIEVQTGNSTEVLSLHEESTGAPNRMQRKGRSQVWKLKEDWDDSTLSSNIIKMRIQNRVEATTRRERALAYAFSQQLRICTKKQPTRSESSEANMGWTWLERWMATRQQESSLEDISKQVEAANNNNQRLTARKRLIFDGNREEKESCGSNEVSIQFDSISVRTERDEFKPPQVRLKATSVSRRKTVPSYHCPKDNSKVSKKEYCNNNEDEKDKKYKAKQPTSKNEAICEDAVSQVPTNLAEHH
ncbi:hypothetical protein LguiB_029857 [Lonicera macranthoides]